MTPDAAQGSPAEPGEGSACVIAPYLFALVYRAMQSSERGFLLTNRATARVTPGETGQFSGRQLRS